MGDVREDFARATRGRKPIREWGSNSRQAAIDTQVSALHGVAQSLLSLECTLEGLPTPEDENAEIYNLLDMIDACVQQIKEHRSTIVAIQGGF